MQQLCNFPVNLSSGTTLQILTMLYEVHCNYEYLSFKQQPYLAINHKKINKTHNVFQRPILRVTTIYVQITHLARNRDKHQPSL